MQGLNTTHWNARYAWRCALNGLLLCGLILSAGFVVHWADFSTEHPVSREVATMPVSLLQDGCPADITGSGHVGQADMFIVLENWGTPNPFADVNGDGIVDGADLGIVLASFGPCEDSLPPATGSAEVHITSEILDSGLIVYRIYVTLENEDDTLVNVFNANITSTDGFMDGSAVTIGTMPPSFDVQHDPNFDFGEFFGGSSMGENAGWFDLNPDKPIGRAGDYPDNNVLIAELAVPEGSTLQGTATCTIRDANGQPWGLDLFINPGQASFCDGHCGEQSPFGCWCDDECMENDDCCEDVCDQCPFDFCDPGIDPYICEGYCGEMAPGGCWCDERCWENDDCCDGVCEECEDELDFCDPGIDPYVCEGYCGEMAPGGCWCDDWCWDFDDCCEDVCDECHDEPEFCEDLLDPYPCTGDLNDDSFIDVFDLIELISDWGECSDPGDCAADLNGDGIVDVFDLIELINNWGQCDSVSTQVTLPYDGGTHVVIKDTQSMPHPDNITVISRWGNIAPVEVILVKDGVQIGSAIELTPEKRLFYSLPENESYQVLVQMPSIDGALAYFNPRSHEPKESSGRSFCGVRSLTRVGVGPGDFSLKATAANQLGDSDCPITIGWSTNNGDNDCDEGDANCETMTIQPGDQGCVETTIGENEHVTFTLECGPSDDPLEDCYFTFNWQHNECPDRDDDNDEGRE